MFKSEYSRKQFQNHFIFFSLTGLSVNMIIDILLTTGLNMLKSKPFWTIISGFYPNDIKGIGTFYDFKNRL